HLRHHPEGERRHDDLRPARQVERFEHVIEGGAAVGGRNRVPAAGACFEGALEPGDRGTVDEFAALAAASDDLLRVGQHPGAVSRDRGSHDGDTSAGAWHRLWRSPTTEFWMLRNVARYEGRT